MGISSSNMGMGDVFIKNSFKRAYRWTWQFEGSCKGINQWMVKTSSRPKITMDKITVEFMNETFAIDGKPKFGEIKMEFLDVVGGPSNALREWFKKHYVYGNPASSGAMSYKMSDLCQNGILTMYGGDGTEVEKWKVYNCWLSEIDFGELKYSGAELCVIKTNLVYQNASLESEGSSSF